jgi:hypothetical protein
MKRSDTRRGNCRPEHDFRQQLVRAASIASLVLAGLSPRFAAHAQSAVPTIEGNFTNTGSVSQWTISGSRYGSPRLPTMDNSGWLRLAGGTDSVLGQVEANAKLASGVPIRVEFDYLIWGGGFDGLSLYFADANAASAGRNGEVGGGLGYCGMSGAYLGIGIDDGGSFAQQYCGIRRFTTMGPQQGTAATGPGVRGNSVTVRGPQSDKYPFVASVGLDDGQDICVTCTDRSQALKALRHVVLDMAPRTPAGSGYTLNMKVNNREILKDVAFPYAPPRELMMGLASTTGAYGANHEIRNLKLSAEGVVVAVETCLAGMGRDGRCLPVDNPMKTWATVLTLGAYWGPIPPELLDGDLAQAGWNGVTSWTQQAPKVPAVPAVGRPCLQLDTHRLPGGSAARANQIIVASRQDDGLNPVGPTQSTSFTKYGATEIRVLYSTNDKASWQWVPDGVVTGNNKVMRVLNLSKTELVTDLSLRVCGTADGNSSPLTEFLLWEKK